MKAEATLTRGEEEDTILLDWATTVLHPNLVTGIFIGRTYYPHPSSPIQITIAEPVCTVISYTIKLVYNGQDSQGRSLCYPTKAEIPDPYPKEFFKMDQEVSMEKAELSPNTYRVEWLKDMFHPPRYEACLSSGQYGGEIMRKDTKMYFIEIPFCSSVELDYKFFHGLRRTATKTLKADCDHDIDDSEGGGGIGVGSMIPILVCVSVLASAVGYVVKRRQLLQGRQPVDGGEMS